jgi:hypothetical protein
MAEYRMSFLDKLDVVILVRKHEAEDDAASIAHAHTICGTHRIVITQANRPVGEIAKGALGESSGGIPIVR